MNEREIEEHLISFALFLLSHICTRQVNNPIRYTYTCSYVYLVINNFLSSHTLVLDSTLNSGNVEVWTASGYIGTGGVHDNHCQTISPERSSILKQEQETLDRTEIHIPHLNGKGRTHEESTTTLMQSMDIAPLLETIEPEKHLPG